MRDSCNSQLKLFSRAISSLLMTVVVFAVAGELYGADAVIDSSQSRVLKHRVVLVRTLPEYRELGKGGEKIDLSINEDARKVLFPESGVVMSLDEWASTLALIEQKVAESPHTRIVETGEDNNKSGDFPRLVVRVGVSTLGPRVFFRLLHGENVMVAVDETGATLDAAIDLAMAKLERELALMRWAAHVVDLAPDGAVINRGYYDGLRKGDRLYVYRLPKAAEGAGMSDNPEIRYLKAQQLGVGTIIRTAENFAVLKSEGEPTFEVQAGDEVVLPEMILPDRTPSSRQSSLFDRVYE